MELKKRLTFGSLMRKRSASNVASDSNADTPEANAARGVRLFCESGAANSGEEVLHLPTIVESAVASPVAALAAAQQIRRFLSKENYSRPHVQYNAIMLIRILADNPGPSFTKNLDKQFADTIKHLLRNGQDPSVAQIVRESLDAMEREKANDTNLNTLFAMWKKEKGLMAHAAKQFGPRTLRAPIWNSAPQNQAVSRPPPVGPPPRTLPPPVELAGRIEEARTSAKLLLQLVQSTPANELLSNELVKEFSERCISAQRSLQAYIACDNPPPDDDTMLTLIETNEQLSLAASKHQRAVLQARRLVGTSPTPPAQYGSSAPAGVQANTYEPSSIPSRDATPSQSPLPPSTSTVLTLPPPAPSTSFMGDESHLPPSLQAGPNRQRAIPQEDNPFADPNSSSAIYSPPAVPPPLTGSNGQTVSPDSYQPGYQSTPSYISRQDSSANNLTMHGAQDATGGQRPRTPEGSRNYGQQQLSHDVSPIAERNTVTYRY